MSIYIMLVSVLTGMFGAVAIDGKSKLYFMEPFTITRYIGVILMIFAVVIRIMVVKQLGLSFNIDIGTLPDQNLQTTKLFSVINILLMQQKLSVSWGWLSLSIML